jgi:hypothetical protein
MAKPNLALIPATIGDKVYSILPSDGVGDFDFDRGTVATRINAQGLIEQVASGVNRLNYSLLDGEVVGCPHLLLEDEATNLIQYSEDFSQSYWTKTNSNVTSNSSISPDGTLNASKLTPSTSNSIHKIASGNVPIVNSLTSYWFVKSNGYSKVSLREDAAVGEYASFDLSQGIVLDSSTSSKIEDYGNGWFRIELNDDLTNVTARNSLYVLPDSYISGSPNLVNWSADGTSSILIWGAQSEEGSFGTSYIPTNGEVNGVTRAAETCDGSGNAATFNDSEGVLMVEISALANDGTNRQISINNNGTSNRVYLEYSSVNNRIRGVVENSDGNQAILSAIVNDVKNYTKAAIKYKQNDFSLFINGFEVDTELNGGVLVGLSELSFDRGDGLSDFYGNTKQIQYFDSILDSEQLEQLTSWDSFRAMAEGQLYTIE